MTKRSNSHREYKKYDPKDYVAALKCPEFFWKPKGKWHDCHDDCKSEFDGAFVCCTMTTSDEEPKYRVKVYYQFFGDDALGPYYVNANSEGGPPTDEDVINALRKEVGLDPK